MKKEFDFYLSCLGITMGFVTTLSNLWPINLFTILGVILAAMSIRLFVLTQINPVSRARASKRYRDLNHTDRAND